ncbi:TPA_asm: hypothetical protein vir520_00033 [Caudoviricetes sp. vir520]|nr:TPA_asm: hypothetical protein vir520_00033 [Caudoviricetes sp. vir520]
MIYNQSGYTICPECGSEKMHIIETKGEEYHIRCDNCEYDDWVCPLDALQEIALYCAEIAKNFIEHMKGDEDIIQVLYNKFYDEIFDNLDKLAEFFDSDPGE